MKSDGTLWAWGYNGDGELGNGTTTSNRLAAPVPGLTGVAAAAAGGYHSVALKSDGTVSSWGANYYGQLGTGTTTLSPTPAGVTGVTGVAAVAAGLYHSLAVLSDGTGRAWGNNGNGQLGNGTATNSLTPATITGLNGLTTITAGGNHSLGVRSDGTVRAWGANNSGQLGTGTTTPSLTPVTVTGLTGVTAATGGNGFSVAVKSDRTVPAWGYNGSGQLGDGTTTTRLAPTGRTATASYSYDGDGLRSSKTANGTTTRFVWDHSAKLPLLLQDGVNNYIYGPEGKPIAHIDNTGAATYYHHDQLGSIRLLTNTTGATVGTTNYDPYGRPTATTGPTTTPFGYAGEYTDAETGFIYLRARYYDPTTGRFLNRDPAEAMTRSAYGYVNGNPLNLTDPTGLFWGEGTLNRVANDVYHPVRAAVTAPVSAAALAVDYGYSAVTGNSVDCNWNSRNWVAVCSGGPTILGAPATTFGGVINTDMGYNDFLQANDCRLMAHETKHTDQWAIFGPGFAALDGVAAGADWAGSKTFGWDPGTHNPFEIWAGLKDGGYR